MSGFVGIMNLDVKPVDIALLSSLTKSMTFRGPDAQTTWIDRQIGFGHALLKTSSDSKETQPLTLDNVVWITADARIDDQATLISQIESKLGQKLKNPGDAELILLAYRAWGKDCLNFLIGDFSFAIWDSRSQELFCARDHFGVKPFYYFHSKNTFVFSNNLNTIRHHPSLTSDLNDLAVADFLVFDYIQDTTLTSFAQINRLPPAHQLILSQNQVSIGRYWTLPVEEGLRYKHSQEYVDHFQEIFNAAVRDRLRTDKVAIWMSGGMDSSTLAATAVGLASSNPLSLRAFTVVYDKLIPYQERYYSGLVAKFLSIPIQYLSADSYYPFCRIDQNQLLTPEPYHNPWAAVADDQYKQVADFCRVGLTGYGGDPLLYSSDIEDLFKNVSLPNLVSDITKCMFVNKKLPRIGFRSYFYRRKLQPLPFPEWISENLITDLKLLDRWRDCNQRKSGLHPVRSRAYECLTNSFWPHRFESMDSSVSGVPIDIRNPYFDVRLVKYLFKLPPVPWFLNKEILRAAMKNRLPEEVRLRPKAPMIGLPEVEFLRKQDGGNTIASAKPVPEFFRYVSEERFRMSLSKGNDGDLWMNLRPVSLNYWLKNKNRFADFLN